MNTRYEYRITALRENGDQYTQQFHYNKTVAARVYAHCKRCPDVDRATYERRVAGSETFEMVARWQRPQQLTQKQRELLENLKAAKELQVNTPHRMAFLVGHDGSYTIANIRTVDSLIERGLLRQIGAFATSLVYVEHDRPWTSREQENLERISGDMKRRDLEVTDLQFAQKVGRRIAELEREERLYPRSGE